MSLINLTPHELRVRGDKGGWIVLPPSGQVARVATSRVAAGKIDPGQPNPGPGDNWEEIPVSSVATGGVTGLPPVVEGVMLIVSQMVRVAVPHRMDVFSPGDLIRDDAGRPIGCDGLDGNWPAAEGGAR